jgi:hypothetical protein
VPVVVTRTGMPCSADQRAATPASASLSGAVSSGSGRSASPLDALHRRGLARAVRPEDPEDLALVHGEGDIADRYGVPVPLVQVLHLDHCCHAFSIAAAGREAHRPNARAVG